MTPDHEKLLYGCPDFISKEQMRIICHISKKTARLLLQNGLVPCTVSNKKTHTYKIAKRDIAEYLEQRDATPEKYILPEGSYARAPTSRTGCCTKASVDFSLFKEYPDVLSVTQAAALSGVSPSTVRAWVTKKHLKAFSKNHAFHIPKPALIECLKSARHRRDYNTCDANNITKQTVTEAETLPSEDFESKTVELSDVDHISDLGLNAKCDIAISIDSSLFDDYPDLLSFGQAVALSGVTQSVLKNWVKKRRFKVFVKSGAYIIPKLALIEYLNTNSAQA